MARIRKPMKKFNVAWEYTSFTGFEEGVFPVEAVSERGARRVFTMNNDMKTPWNSCGYEILDITEVTDGGEA
jgi:hypothetical protein